MRWILIVLFGFSSMFISVDLGTAEEFSGVRGKVINGTSGHTTPEGLEIRIRLLSSDGEIIELEARTGPEGEFVFFNFGETPILFYTLETTYFAVPYRIEVDPQLVHGPVEVVVYEVVNSLAELTIVDHSVVVTGVDRREQTLQVLEAIKIRNLGDRTFFVSSNTSDPMSLLRFSLPIGSSELEVEASSGGGHVIQIDRGFALTVPIPPGEHEILFTYNAPYENEGWQYSPLLIRGAENFRFMVSSEIGQFYEETLIGQGDIQVGGQAYQLFQRQGLEAGERLNINLTDLPDLRFDDHLVKLMNSQIIFLGVIPGIAGLGFLLLLWIGFKRRKPLSS